ncbi:hypothetical protein CW1_4293, partial [Bacteroides xylanisolvens SD CC 2a]
MIYRKGNAAALNACRFPLYGSLLRRLSGLRSHFQRN